MGILLLIPLPATSSVKAHRTLILQYGSGFPRNLKNKNKNIYEICIEPFSSFFFLSVLALFPFPLPDLGAMNLLLFHSNYALQLQQRDVQLPKVLKLNEQKV